MAQYNTKQRRILLEYLNEHPDEMLSARQIADALRHKEISQSAVYRNLATLESEEKVRRSTKSGTREVYYQYVAAEACKGVLHMSCLQCGKTYHMEEKHTAAFSEFVAQEEKFQLDTTDTVLFGVCVDCHAR